MRPFRTLFVVTLALFAAGPALAQRASCHRGASFEQWLDAFKREAVSQGVSALTIAAASHLMVYDQTVVNKDRGQKVFSQTFLDFSDRMVARHRIDGGIQRIAKNRALFTRVEQQFGVPGPVIAAFWALETDFGGFMGNLPTIKSVASLAYDCRRPDLFRTQLLSTLKIIERGDLSADQMIGPFAGELGQFQFLSAHYYDYGLDYDGDGRRDLIGSAPDAVASAANYLSKIGWKRGEPWLEEVRVPANLPWEQADLAIQHPRSQWAKWGVTKAGGGQIAADAQPSSLLLPMGRHGPAFLAYPNFKAFMGWNSAFVYSTTAAYFATRLAGAPQVGRGNAEVVPPTAQQIADLQRALLARGYETGEVDGKLGAMTRKAVKQAQIKLGMPADAYPDPELTEKLRLQTTGNR